MNKKTSRTDISQPSCGYYFSSGIVVSETVYSSAIHGPLYNVASRIIVDGGRKAIATAAMAGMLVQNLKTPAEAADVGPGQYRFVYQGQTSNNLTVSGNLTNTANLYVSGTTNNTVLQFRGSEHIASGGVANSTRISSGGRQYVGDYGSAISTYISAGGYLDYENAVYISGITQAAGGMMNAYVLGRQAEFEDYGQVSYISGTNVNGGFTQQDGVARNFIISSGANLDVEFGGSAINIQQEEGGRITTWVTKSRTGTAWEDADNYIWGTNENGAFSLQDGVARNFVLNSGSYVVVHGGGSAYGVVQNAGGNICAVVAPGDSTVIQGNNVSGAFSLANGVASNFILYGSDDHKSEPGELYIVGGGKAYNVKNSGGAISVDGIKPDDGTYINGTNQDETAFLLENGSASGFVMNDGAGIIVSSGGIIKDTEVKDGALLAIKQGGYASGLTHNSGGNINAIVAGGDTSTYVQGNYYSSAGAAARPFLLENGSASGFAIHNNYTWEADDSTVYHGGLIVSSGGKATDILIENGGVSVDVYPNDVNTVVSGSRKIDGKTFRLQNGVASGFVVKEDDYINVHSGGSAIAVSGWGGNVNVEVIGGDTATLVSGSNDNGQFRLYNGSASNFVINPFGSMKVYAGGSAIDTHIRGEWIYEWNEVYAGNLVMSGTNTLYGNTTVEEGGLITLARDSSEPDVPVTLNIENLYSEDGVFDINVDLENKTADKIVITEHAEGKGYIRLNNTAAGAGNINGTNLHLVEYPDDADYDAEFELWGRKYRYGVHNYTLSQGYDEDEELVYWYLSGGGGGEYIPVYAAALTMPQISVVGVNITLNSMQKRLGDLRGMGNSDGHGVWARAYYKGMTVKGEAETDMNTAGTEAGYDYVAMDDGSARLYLGLMAGAASYSGIKSEGKSAGEKYRNDGSGSSVLGGVYGTYIMDNGWFFDATLRAGTSELDISNYTYDEDFDEWDKVSFKPKRTFAAASIEAGKLFDKRNGGIGWKFEPKAEIQLTNTPAKTIKDSDGEELRFGGANYITGIATLSASYSRGDGIEPYAEVSWSQEMSGKEDITYLTETEESSMKGGTAEIAVGLNMKLSDDLYWHAAASYESGSKKKGYGADAGIRYMFGGSGRKANSDKAINAKDDHLPQPTEQKENEQEIVINENSQQFAGNEIIYEDNSAKIITASRPSGETFTILDVDEYDVKAEEAEKFGSDSGIMPIPSAGILFQIGKHEILPYYHPMLDKFINLYKQTDGNAKIQIEGYSSNGGNETVKNPDLSKQRARAVYRYLIENGISKENISVKAYGNRRIGEGLFRGDPNCKAGQCYRRVDVSIIGN